MYELTKSEFLSLNLHKNLQAVTIADSEFVQHKDAGGERYESWATGFIQFSNGPVELEVPWFASGGTNSIADALTFTVELAEGGSDYELSGLTLCAENGNPLEKGARDAAVAEFLNGFDWAALVKARLPKTEKEAEALAVPAEDGVVDGVVEVVVERDGERSIRFAGELIASAQSSPRKALGTSYSGSAGRWQELTLYKTRGGRYVCERVDCSNREGEHNRHSGAVCETIAEVIEFFGLGRLAKALYDYAGIDDSIRVE